MPCAEIAVAGIHNWFSCVDVFDLDGCVVDFELFVHQAFDACEHGTMIEIVCRLYYMTAHGEHPGCESLYMEIMYRTDAGNLIQLLLKINDVDVRRSSLQQYVDCIPN